MLPGIDFLRQSIGLSPVAAGVVSERAEKWKRMERPVTYCLSGPGCCKTVVLHVGDTRAVPVMTWTVDMDCVVVVWSTTLTASQATESIGETTNILVSSKRLAVLAEAVIYLAVDS